MNNDRISELYEGEIGSPASQQRARARIHWMCARAAGATVLDVGCSQGIASILLAREGRQVTGVDIETAALEEAHARLAREEPHIAGRVDFRFAEGADLPFDDASFDTVLLGEVVEHLIDPVPVVREARRVLRDDGVLVLTTPYGIFRYPDHKEPVYLRPLIEMLAGEFAIEHVEVLDRWLGITARAAPPDRAGVAPEVWARALDAAEGRLQELDSTLEERRDALKSTQAKLNDLRAETDDLRPAAQRGHDLERVEQELAATRDSLFELQAAHAAQARELAAALSRHDELNARAIDVSVTSLDAERRAAVAEGRLQAMQERAEAARQETETLRERLAAAADEAAEREQTARQEAQTLRARLAAVEEEAARAAAAEARADELAARLADAEAGQRLDAGRLAATRLALAEAERARDAAEATARELEAAATRADQAAEAAAQRAATAERTLATERESTREAAISAVRALEEGSSPAAAAPPPAGNGHSDETSGPVALRTAAPGDLVRPVAVPAPAPTPPRAFAPSAMAVAEPPQARRDRADRQALTAEARALHRNGEFEAAEELFRTLLENDPEESALWLGLARALNGRKLFEQALDAVEQARRLRPGWRDAIWLTLQLCARLERKETFAALAPELGAPQQLAVKDLERLGPLALRAGVHDLALAAGETLLAAEPGNGRGVEILAAARWELGDEAGARELVEAGVGSGTPAMLRAALMFAVHIDGFGGVDDLLARLDPPEPDLIVEFADLLLKRGQPDRALALLELLERAAPDDARLASCREAADAQLRVHTGAWAPAVVPRRYEPVPGRVLHLVSHSLPHHTSGGTYRTQYTATAQQSVGLDPHLVTRIGFPWDAGVADAAPSDQVEGLTYHRIVDDDPAGTAPDARLRRNLEGLIPLVERLRPAVLHPASTHWNALVALQLREIFGIPVVYEVRGFPEERLVRRPGSRVLKDQSVGKRALELQCMLGADRIVTLAEVMRDHMVGNGVPAEKIHLVPNGVDTEKLSPVHRDGALAARIGLREGEIVLGYVSTFHSYEGIQYIIEATAELIARGHPARALLVGDGRDRAVLERRARELGVAGEVIFTGRVPHAEVLGYYGLIDLFIVPRRAEATSELVTPLKPFEAMAVQRPVIVSDVAALREIVRDGVTGRSFRPEDSLHLADVAEELITHPEERVRLARAGREWVAAERTWSANGGRYHALYADLGVV